MQDFGEQPKGMGMIDSALHIDPIRSRCKMEVFDQKLHPVDTIAAEIFNIHSLIFPQTLPQSQITPDDTPERVKHLQHVSAWVKKDKIKHLTKLVSDPRSTLILCNDGEGKYVGYTLATPIGLSDPLREEESSETAYIFNTGFLPDYQGHKLVGDIMPVLEEQLRHKKYSFMERDVRMEKGYHLHVERNYGDRIVAKNGPNSSWIGPQMFYRIKL